MGLTLIEAAKYENRLEHLAVLKTFSEGELLARLPFMNTEPHPQWPAAALRQGRPTQEGAWPDP